MVASNHKSVLDWGLLFALIGIALFGAVMITSASMPFAEKVYGDPFYFTKRQLLFLVLGFIGAVGFFCVSMATWERLGPALIIFSLICLALVLVPGIGKKVNGSQRWIDLGFMTVQVSEAVKLFIVIYLSGYLVRRGELVQTTLGGFISPLFLIMGASGLLLLEPDFGAAVVIVLTSMLMLFIAGVRLHQFIALVTGLAAVGYLLILDFALSYGEICELSQSLGRPVRHRLSIVAVTDCYRQWFLEWCRPGKQCAKTVLPARGPYRFLSLRFCVRSSG